MPVIIQPFSPIIVTLAFISGSLIHSISNYHMSTFVIYSFFISYFINIHYFHNCTGSLCRENRLHLIIILVIIVLYYTLYYNSHFVLQTHEFSFKLLHNMCYCQRLSKWRSLWGYGKMCEVHNFFLPRPAMTKRIIQNFRKVHRSFGIHLIIVDLSIYRMPSNWQSGQTVKLICPLSVSRKYILI